MGVKMYNPVYVSNNFLMRSFEQGIYITPMKLQKMLYFLYRDYLQKTKEPLFTERFMAWKYGPVLDSVYQVFKQYRSNSIKQYGGYSGQAYMIKEESNEIFRNILSDIWDKCKNFDGIHLSTLTHSPEGAWIKAYRNASPLLDDNAILADSTRII
jgi:uncharacterized phage-associated protein